MQEGEEAGWVRAVRPGKKIKVVKADEKSLSLAD